MNCGALAVALLPHSTRASAGLLHGKRCCESEALTALYICEEKHKVCSSPVWAHSKVELLSTPVDLLLSPLEHWQTPVHSDGM